MALIPIAKTMREIQDRTKGRVVLELLEPNNPTKWIARIFEPEELAEARVRARMQTMQATQAVGLLSYVELLEKECNKQLNYATGKTAERALDALANKVL